MGTRHADTAPRMLLIVRERLRPGSEAAYAENELEIAAACARLGCPHPYLGLVAVAGPAEVWWLNAFASEQERAQVESAYASNEALMASLRLLGERKASFKPEVTTTLVIHRPDLSKGAWRIDGARFFVVAINPAGDPAGAVFESPDGERFSFSAADSRAAADGAAAAAPGSRILAVQPQWSFPDSAWVAADREFWTRVPD